ncbi:hypothetical protein RSUY_03040 [Ralstonia solanacearum]|nr:hypothetical protein RSUY_03040 [Ralstonia solanacearum]
MFPLPTLCAVRQSASISPGDSSCRRFNFLFFRRRIERPSEISCVYFYFQRKYAERELNKHNSFLNKIGSLKSVMYHIPVARTSRPIWKTPPGRAPARLILSADLDVRRQALRIGQPVFPPTNTRAHARAGIVGRDYARMNRSRGGSYQDVAARLSRRFKVPGVRASFPSVRLTIPTGTSSRRRQSRIKRFRCGTTGNGLDVMGGMAGPASSQPCTRRTATLRSDHDRPARVVAWRRLRGPGQCAGGQLGDGAVQNPGARGKPYSIRVVHRPARRHQTRARWRHFTDRAAQGMGTRHDRRGALHGNRANHGNTAFLLRSRAATGRAARPMRGLRWSTRIAAPSHSDHRYSVARGTIGRNPVTTGRAALLNAFVSPRFAATMRPETALIALMNAPSSQPPRWL